MSLIVCKFGGTSVASPERIQMVAKKLIAKKQAGHDVVAVVSAMGKTTDELVGLAAALNDNPSTPMATSPRSAAAAPTPRLWPWRTA